MTTAYKQQAFNWIDQNRQSLSDWHQVIWHLAEPAWREYKSSAWYVTKLRDEGFEVEEGSGGMPTAFMATWYNGEGPNIGAYAEYDAVPGNCQAAAIRKKPRRGLSRFAPGHTDPHSALGMGSLGGILAAKQIMQHCKVAKGWVARSRPGLANHALADLTYRNLALAGAPKYNAQAVNLARKIQQNLGLDPMEKPYLEACEKLISPQEAENELRGDMPAWQKNWTSDDYVEMSWHAPTVRLYVARPMLKLPQGSAGYPDWVANALGGLRDCIDPTIMTAAKTIAATIIDLLTDTNAMKKIRGEFIERTGGGIGGDKWIPPLLPQDFEAPIHYPWPEYVTTQRGDDWVIPSCGDY